MRRNIKELVFGCVIVLALVIIWFHSGYVIASGESGLFFHSIEHVINFYGQTWFSGAIGFPGNGLPLIDLPLFKFVYFLRFIHIPYVFIQGGLYFFLQATGFVSVYAICYLLTPNLKKSKRKIISLLAALFYIFNQINIVTVLNRMQYPFLFSYALIPLGLVILIIAIQKRQVRYSLIIPLITFFLAPSFSEISSLILFWSVLVLFTLFHFFIFDKNRRFFLFSITFFLISITGWVFISSWWILPMLKTLGGSPYVTKLTYNPNADLDVFLALSKILGNLSYIFRMMHHDFYLWEKDVWSGYFQNPIIILLTFMPPVLVYGSLLIKKKVPYYFYFIFMALFVVFAMKGTASPFGGIFQFLFTHVRFLESFRNPFEKISIVLPLFYSLPFAFGIYGLYEFITRRWSLFFARITFAVIVLVCFVILVLPMWNGWVFTGSTIPSNNTSIGFKVKVPDYYAQADSWLQYRDSNSRVIALPIGEEVITYNWQYGYNGVELSNGLFGNSFISYCTTIQFLCEMTHGLQPLLRQYPNDFWKVFAPLQARYLMVRKDTNYVIDQMQNPVETQNSLANAKNIITEKSFGPLDFYSDNSSYDTPKIFAATKGIYLDGENSYMDAAPLADFEKKDIYFTGENLQNNELGNSHQIILQANEFIPQQLKISKENALLELPYVRFLPGSPFYLWTRWRENFDNFLAGSSDVPNLVVQSDKRLVEAYKLLTLGKRQTADSTMGEYVKLLNYFYNNNIVFSEDKEKEDLLRQKYVLADELSLAKSLRDTSKVFPEASQILDNLLRRAGLEPLVAADTIINRVYVVHVPINGDYTLKISKQDYARYYPMDELTGIIDNKNRFSVDTGTTGSFLTLGAFHFSKGDHQVTIPVIDKTNLLPKNSLAINTKVGDTRTGIISNTYSFPVSNLESLARYTLSFDYKVTSGNPFQVAFIEDSEELRDPKGVTHYNPLEYTGHLNTWYHYEVPITLHRISKAGKLVLYIYPGNTCKKDNKDISRCGDASFNKQFNTPSKAEIKNLSFTREDIGNLFLTQERSVQGTYQAPRVTFTEENPARYIVRVNEALTPFYLTFLEAYHPLWKLYYIENGKNIPVSENNHLFVNSYANAWLLNRKGSYSMLLEFAPQSFFEIGTKISIMTFSILVTVMGIYIGKKLLKKKQ